MIIKRTSFFCQAFFSRFYRNCRGRNEGKMEADGNLLFPFFFFCATVFICEPHQRIRHLRGTLNFIDNTDGTCRTIAPLVNVYAYMRASPCVCVRVLARAIEWWWSDINMHERWMVLSTENNEHWVGRTLLSSRWLWFPSINCSQMHSMFLPTRQCFHSNGVSEYLGWLVQITLNSGKIDISRTAETLM